MIVEKLLELPAVIDVESNGDTNMMHLYIVENRYDMLTFGYRSIVGKAWVDPYSNLGFTDKLIWFDNITDDDGLLNSINIVRQFLIDKKLL